MFCIVRESLLFQQQNSLQLVCQFVLLIVLPGLLLPASLVLHQFGAKFLPCVEHVREIIKFVSRFRKFAQGHSWAQLLIRLRL